MDEAVVESDGCLCSCSFLEFASLAIRFSYALRGFPLGRSRFCSDFQAPAALTLADLDDRLEQAASFVWDKGTRSPPSRSTTASSIYRK